MTVDYLSALNTGGSGLNIKQIVDSIVNAETAPKKDLIDKKIEKQNIAISDLATVVSDLNDLKSDVLNFKNKTKLVTSTTNTTASSLTISNPSTARPFSSDINIASLATSQTLEFSGFTLPTSTTGSGTINIEFGQWFSGASSDSESLYSKESVVAGTSLGTPISHVSLGGNITLTSEGGDLSSTSFTISGTDMAGNTMTETITGPTLGATVTGSSVFKTVTSIVPNNTVIGGSVTAGHSATTFGPNSSKSSQLITIASGSTLNTVANTLSSVEGVSANIINKGDGTYSLLVRSDTGLNNALRLTVSEASGDAGLATFDTTSDNATHQTVAASNASINVDGVNITRSSNTINDLFDGYTLDLKTTTSSSFRVSASLDKTAALSTLKDFIDTINISRTKLNEFTRTGSQDVEEGSLKSNIAVKNIKDGINSIITGEIKGFGNNSMYLSELGVRTNADGTLTVNETTFNKQIDNNSTVFDSIFNSLFSSNSPYLKVEGAGINPPKPGVYSYVADVSSTELRSNASYVSPQTIVVASTTGIEVGDFVTGNGIPSSTTVTSIVGSTITLSNTIENNSTISSGTSISFKNATLNSYAMTSTTDSNNISSFVSSGTSNDASGIKVTPSQDVSNAFIYYGKSLVDKLSDLLTSTLSASGSLEKSKTNINDKLLGFNNDISELEDKANLLTARYTEQFTSMEKIVTSLKSTGDYMENMLKAWNDDD